MSIYLFKAFFLESGEGDSGGFMEYILAQTGFVKSGSDLEGLHASVWENIEMYEYQKETFFVLCSVIGGSN